MSDSDSDEHGRWDDYNGEYGHYKSHRNRSCKIVIKKVKGPTGSTGSTGPTGPTGSTGRPGQSITGGA